MKRTKTLPIFAISSVFLAIFHIAIARGTELDDRELSHQFNVTSAVSLTEGQTLRINLLNTGSDPLEIIPCVFDGDGLHLKTGATLRIGPGQTQTFDLMRAEAGRRTEPFVSVRGGVHANESDLKNLFVSAEVVEDTTGKTSIFVPTVLNPSDLTRESDEESLLPGEVTRSLAPVGITAGQLLRVSFLNVGSNPLEIIPCIFDGDGAHLKTGAMLQLRPGQTLTLQMDYAEASRGGESRLLVRGAAHLRNSDRKYLLVTGEVVETVSGRSSLYLPGSRVGFDPQPDPPSH